MLDNILYTVLPWGEISTPQCQVPKFLEGFHSSLLVFLYSLIYLFFFFKIKTFSNLLGSARLFSKVVTLMCTHISRISKSQLFLTLASTLHRETISLVLISLLNNHNIILILVFNFLLIYEVKDIFISS